MYYQFLLKFYHNIDPGFEHTKRALHKLLEVQYGLYQCDNFNCADSHCVPANCRDSNRHQENLFKG